MTLSMTQAINFCKNTFQGDDCVVNPKLKNSPFDRRRLQRLPQEDRKIIAKALTMVGKAKKLSDVKKTSSIKKPLDEKRLEDITAKVKAALPSKTHEKKTEWYKAPFVWIAKIAHSLFLGLMNTFAGRVSTQNLFDKVEAYRNDFEHAKTRHVNLLPRTGEVWKVTHGEIDKDLAEEKKINEVQMPELSALQKILLNIERDFTLAAAPNSANNNIIKIYDLLEHDHEIKNVETLAEIVLRRMGPKERAQKYFDNGKSYFDDERCDESCKLWSKANEPGVPEKKVADEFRKAYKKITNDITKNLKRLDNCMELLAKHYKEEKAINDEAELLKTKYLLEPIPDPK